MLSLVEALRAEHSEQCSIPCTKCGYCVACPNGVDIPRASGICNRGVMHDRPDLAGKDYEGGATMRGPAGALGAANLRPSDRGAY